MKTSHNRAARRAFTLVELLVVVATVAVLALVLVPVQARTRSGSTALGCKGNLEQIGRAVFMYGEENADLVPAANNWFLPGPYINSRGFSCGAEWKGTGVNSNANSPAPLLVSYLPDNYAWVCPLRKRGLRYIAEPGEFDPSVTGFLSYGFNLIAVFAKADSNGNMTSGSAGIKLSSLPQPANLVGMVDVSGPIDAGSTAAHLTTVWLGLSGIGSSGMFDYRVQTAYAKHNRRLNFLFMDGRVTPLLASRVTWGQFAGVSDPNANVVSASGPGHKAGEALTTPANDSIEWSSAPE